LDRAAPVDRFAAPVLAEFVGVSLGAGGLKDRSGGRGLWTSREIATLVEIPDLFRTEIRLLKD